MVARHCELIFFLLINSKCDLGEVEKAKFQVSHVTLTHFRHLDHPNKRLGWSRESFVSRGRMTFSTYFRHLDQPKMRLGWIKKENFLVVARHCELIFCLLTCPKCDLDEVEKAKIQVLEWHFEVIFCFLINRKCDFFKTISRRFKWSNGT